jgi:hypothetical protein
MQVYVWMKAQLHAFLTSAIDRVGWNDGNSLKIGLVRGTEFESRPGYRLYLVVCLNQSRNFGVVPWRLPFQSLYTHCS